MTYPDEYTASLLAEWDIPHRPAALPHVAQLLADGKIVGWFQGGSEYGPRALGNRSILADSRKEEIKDILNRCVKHRESFRPYAPVILKEYSSEYFDLEAESPYMLLIAKVRQPTVIPAVTHIDRTARVQTVTRQDNRALYDLIQAFHMITGVPCVLNTSFNDSGEPIVETPEDALICFSRTKIDYLVIGPFLVDANDVDKIALADRLERARRAKLEIRRQTLLTRHFPGYSEPERDYFIAESNKMSEWHAKYRSKYELEKKVLEWIQRGSRILIVGTRDHTAILPHVINSFARVAVVGFSCYGRPVENTSAQPLPYLDVPWADIAAFPCDEVLISSYEYNFEILERIQVSGLGRPAYPIYDTASRSFLETLAPLPRYRRA